MHWGSWLQQETAEWDIHLSHEQLRQFHRYYELLVEKNKVMNLTAITEEKEVYIKHFYDSLTLARVIPLNRVRSVIDVGTGAGFPGLALKIAFPHLRVVLLDSLKKRVNFLNEVVEELGLTRVECIHGRAEEFGKKKGYRQNFDLATARAVARLNVLAEYCLPFVKVGGHFIAMKGPDVKEEMEEAGKALHTLGKTTLEVKQFRLPEEMGTRSLLWMKKRDHTPKAYPRKAGTPAKQPLV
ncbi:16S rRNA (guanine(527)-N(7))-methyltransferase RsmG [Thermoactinomyces intermedius]|jgi:16S rRNA (guanine527-N7)-methyltransferase|uniref:Ribosomal RNA small subunit methyltransferase G n=1 Tax=Thermoactinomyces intermedius TaxID=2024 RepID=A0A8I1DG64_THEIN|nr:MULTISPECIES: 16S rRNA (guanine(527)-N(7))-methyltransferase RsmG [Thermoactinomyces]MBA4549981.1 16S rRNA (guanine(527)-N(7))-methyltransferase RsmG [Thermoactinomyces intermedius]MBA4835727.1 16S rRNA (guanine(527)-N(7))-methyltransferase RsmG [Thermoactinomyces intermedius]MBH8596310.1 16S rRNA (guanine(527)-N(7))-methyltransferase RsmG [Thermoactinomyces intermedius]MBH8600452.1 16S rRNA (guanine(527)-N(7))-methyltransferase RsmG [Thermoactinomyces sp. CICC 23799]